MKNIVVLGASLKQNQKKRLNKLGKVKYSQSPSSSKDFIKKAEDADIVYSDGAFLLENLSKLKNVFVTYPYVELGIFNSKELKKNGVVVANSQGGNRDSIIEWVMYMTLSLFRNFTPMVRAKKNFPVKLQQSLVDKNVLIIGKGSIGSKIAIPCKAFGMKVSFFNRGENLRKKSSNADLVINALNCNSTSKNLLNERFFMSLKKGAYYLTFVRPYTYDIDGLLKSINKGIVAGAAIDCDPENFGDTKNKFYRKALSNPKVLVTPHIAFSTTQAVENGGEIAVQNIESFASGKPKNILKKT